MFSATFCYNKNWGLFDRNHFFLGGKSNVMLKHAWHLIIESNDLPQELKICNLVWPYFMTQKTPLARWFKPCPFHPRSLEVTNNPLKGSRFHHPKKVTAWITRYLIALINHYITLNSSAHWLNLWMLIIHQLPTFTWAYSPNSWSKLETDSYIPLKFNIAPEKWWLEDYFPIGKVTFQGLCQTSGG